MVIYSTEILLNVLHNMVCEMGVPEEIRKVARPTNTVVIDNGGDGPKRWAVRARKSSGTYVPGKNPMPINGGIIGHIVNGVYVPLVEPLAEKGPEELQFGPAALFRSVTEDIMDDLLRVIDAEEAYIIMAMAGLRFAHPGISNKRLSTDYRRSFFSVYYPGVHISANSVCDLLQRLGMDGAKRRSFYDRRMERVLEEHHIVVDGTLKQDNSTINDLSDFSHKARTKGCRDISVIYAYDIEMMEPICFQVFPGNTIDSRAYSTFIRDNDIRKGILVTDKGFPPSKIRDELEARPGLHFLTPLKRNAKVITNNSMYEFEGALKGYEGVWFKKVQLKGGNFLYSYKDIHKANAEEMNYNRQKARTGNFDFEDYERKDRRFGTIVFESDQDLEPEMVYSIYEERWTLELVFNRYKNDIGLDDTRVQNDYSVIGSEFVNFIATVATTRVLRRARDAGLLDAMSFGDLMDDLRQCWRKIDSPKEPSNDDGFWVHPFEAGLEAMAALGLSKPVPKPEPKKRGRKPKNPQPE